VLSNIQSSGISSSAATIAWSTDKPADTQVDYGTTTAYGLTSPLNTSLVTSHSQQLNGLASATLYHYRVRSKDAAGNLALSGDFTFLTTCSCDVSLWNNSVSPPSSTDPKAVEVGVKFQTDVAGFVKAIRFYKGSLNTGTHIVNLWTSTGTLLAQAQSTGETASGWQQVNLPSPVAIAANTIYVASYFTSSGNYAVNVSYFTAGVNNPPLHALPNSTPGGNGVYRYGSTSGFPVYTSQASNYWVDLVFSQP
jgi:hypothetical protein